MTRKLDIKCPYCEFRRKPGEEIKKKKKVPTFLGELRTPYGILHEYLCNNIRLFPSNHFGYEELICETHFFFLVKRKCAVVGKRAPGPDIGQLESMLILKLHGDLDRL